MVTLTNNTNHSYHTKATELVYISYGVYRGEHTDTQIDTLRSRQDQFLETRRVPATGWHMSGFKMCYNKETCLKVGCFADFCHHYLATISVHTHAHCYTLCESGVFEQLLKRYMYVALSHKHKVKQYNRFFLQR